MFPPIPSWDGLHPLVVHFPIALLLVAPLFMLVAIVLPKRGVPFALAALALLVLGTIAAFVTVSTGSAAAELAERNTQLSAVLERHEELAEFTRNLFVILAIAYALIVLLPLFLPRIFTWARITAQVLFLLVYLGGALMLARTAHEGGRLVHEFGVRAMMASNAPPPGPAVPAASPAAPVRQAEHDRD